MLQPPEFNFSFQEELCELDALVRQAFSAYLAARDALFAHYGAGFLESDQLWIRYCETVETLERAVVESEHFVGSASLAS